MKNIPLIFLLLSPLISCNNKESADLAVIKNQILEIRKEISEIRREKKETALTLADSSTTDSSKVACDKEEARYNETKVMLSEIIKLNKELIEIKKSGNNIVVKEIRQDKELVREEIVSLDDDPILGNKDAKVVMVEFSDFQCPFCARFYKDAFKQIKKKYVETGKIKYVLRDYPLSFHNNAKKAAEAADCAGDQGKYWEMHDKLFDNQFALSIDNLKGYAKDIGLESDRFNECIDNGRFTQEVEKDIEDGEELDISVTPSFFIGVANGNNSMKGRYLSGAQSYTMFKKEIDKALLIAKK